MLRGQLQSVPRSAILREEGYFVWGGGVVQDDVGTYHLIYARWPKEHGFHSWVTHSEAARAVSDDPLGPYEPVDVILGERGPEHWDGHCVHNPTVERFDDRYYLYYTGNVGDREETESLNWTHRNNQRIGVAVADHPSGPWERFDKPVIDTTSDFVDSLCCANPSVTRRPDGGYLMVYKTVDDENELPFGGPVRHAVALAPDPTGPFEKQPEPIFTKEDENFPAEDPYIWRGEDRYWAIVKDQDGHFTDSGKSLALFESFNGTDWCPTDDPLVSTTTIEWDDETIADLHSLERPQLWIEDGTPSVLFCSATMDRKTDSFNVHIPLSEKV